MGRDVHVTCESSIAASCPASSVEMDLVVSSETNAEMDRLALEVKGTKSDILKRGLALLKLTVDVRKQGKKLAVISANDQIETEMTGI